MSPPAHTAAETTPDAPRRVVRRIGVVESDKMQKTIVVRVDRKVRHPVYKKYVKRHTRLVAHDERNEARVGDRVEIAFTRPLSRTKRWRLLRIVAAAPGGAARAGATAGTAGA